MNLKTGDDKHFPQYQIIKRPAVELGGGVEKLFFLAEGFSLKFELFESVDGRWISSALDEEAFLSARTWEPCFVILALMASSSS